MHEDKLADFKAPSQAIEKLITALKNDQSNYTDHVVNQDSNPDHWLVYADAGYSLVEDSFTLLLEGRRINGPARHSLSALFNSFDEDDKMMLGEYYTDYKANIGGERGEIIFDSLDDFILYLDAVRTKRGGHDDQPVPQLFYVEYMHEIIHGCIRILVFAERGGDEPSQFTYSKRGCNDSA